jgi:hypothetical protein
MSLAAVQTEILEPMQALFLPPRDMDAAAQTTALRAYGAVLEPFDAPDLRTAWGEVVCEHRTRAWPVPGVIVSAARKARNARIGADAPARRIGGIDWAARRRHWEHVRLTRLASDAIEAGVAWSLKCAIRGDGRQAHEIDLGELIRRRRNAEDTAQAIGDGAPVFHRGRKLTFSESNRALALKMWANQLRNEDAAVAEIRHWQGIAP